MSNYVEIEVKAKSVELAVQAAMQELGVDDPEMLDVEVISEPVKGFLGIGGQDAVVNELHILFLGLLLVKGGYMVGIFWRIAGKEIFEKIHNGQPYQVINNQISNTV